MKIGKWLIVLSVLLPVLAAAQTYILPDTNFRNCLKTKYPGVLTQSGRLDTQKAAAMEGYLDCAHQNISSVDGLRYFSSISHLFLDYNSISVLPSLNDLLNLEELFVTNNKLNYLPDLSAQKRLKKLYAWKNELKVLTDLSHNDSLQYLDVNNNSLDTLPYLGNLEQLKTLTLNQNKLKYIPGVDKLTNLNALSVWGNSLLALPISDLEKLVLLDVSQNQLSQFPQFSNPSTLEKVYFDRNNLTSLPDFSGYKSLQIMRLFTNRLSFKELVKLTAYPDYDTLFNVFHQKTFRVGVKIHVKEGEAFTISTGIDNEVPGVFYEWYKNGKLLNTVVTDNLIIPSVTMQDSGKYTCLIRHPAFEVKLQTDTFYISIQPCLDLSAISTSISGHNCLVSGSLTVSGVKSVSQSFTHQLKSKATGKIFVSTEGKFSGLTEPAYTLSVSTKEACERTFSETILIPTEACKEMYITPNNDGDTDSIFFPQTGSVTIYDKRGSPVKTITIPSEWDGTAKNGRVAQGYYTADINHGEELINISVMY